jgi:hypothetical protein
LDALNKNLRGAKDRSRDQPNLSGAVRDLEDWNRT